MGYHKEVYLTPYYSYKIPVSAEGYQQIWELIQKVKVCEKCDQYYSAENINVAGNICLRCFLRENSHLEYQGPVNPQEAPTPEKDAYYLFLSKKDGHRWKSHAGAGYSDKASEESALTLAYWNFPRPERGKWNSEMVKLGETWKIYGDVRFNKVIVIVQDKFVFMVKRGGPATQLTRRSSKQNFILDVLREELEAEFQAAKKDSEGYAILEGEKLYQIWDSHVYTRLARVMSQEWEAIEAERQPEAAEEAEASPEEPGPEQEAEEEPGPGPAEAAEEAEASPEEPGAEEKPGPAARRNQRRSRRAEKIRQELDQ